MTSAMRRPSRAGASWLSTERETGACCFGLQATAAVTAITRLRIILARMARASVLGDRPRFLAAEPQETVALGSKSSSLWGLRLSRVAGSLRRIEHVEQALSFGLAFR